MSMAISGIGRLGRDAETKYAANGTVITEVSFCSSEWNAKENRNDATWYKLVMFGDRFSSDKLGKHLLKGKQVSIVGKLKPEDYTNKQGKTVTSLNIIVYDLELILEKKDSSETTQQVSEDQEDPSDPPQPKVTSAKASTAPAPARNTPKTAMTPVSNINIKGVPNFPSQELNDDNITEEDIPF